MDDNKGKIDNSLSEIQFSSPLSGSTATMNSSNIKSSVSSNIKTSISGGGSNLGQNIPLKGGNSEITGNLDQNPNITLKTGVTQQNLERRNSSRLGDSDSTTDSNFESNRKFHLTEEDYKGKTIAEILRSQGKIKEEQEKEVKFEVANKRISEEEVIKSKGWINDEEIIKAKAASYGVPYVNLDEEEIPHETLLKLPYESAKSHQAIVFREDVAVFHVGMADPLDIQRVSFLENILGKRIRPYFANPASIKTILDTRYAGQMESEVSEAVEEVGEGIIKLEEEVRDISEVEGTIASAPVARIVNMILEYSIKFGASDIHIEPREKKLSVRFRINGILMERLQLPVTLVSSIVSRIKILSDLKIDEHRIPQDGRFQVKVGKKEVDLRVSIMPTVYGEKVVIRLLEKGGGLMKLEDTGLRGAAYKIYREALSSTQGIILVTGPTGSGKTQTLASSLMILNQPGVNIVTLEDPVEIKIDGVNQVQVNPDVGLTFAKGLRAMLRQDPDIIMVGEIRDRETAELAVQASLTGHLVLATLHTNSASGALPRLLDMHIEPYLLTSTINVIVAQRLIRTLCNKCKEAYEASDEVIKKVHKVMAGLAGFNMYTFPNNFSVSTDASLVNEINIPPAEIEKQRELKQKRKVVLYRAKGCSKCNNTGYSGRTGIFEVFRVSDKISQLIMEERSAGDIERQAIEEGMITMVQDGFMKALEGLTTIEEVLRVQKK